jgi:hypothetical protein
MTPQQDARKALIKRLRAKADEYDSRDKGNVYCFDCGAEPGQPHGTPCMSVDMLAAADALEALSESSASSATPPAAVHRSGSLLYTLMHDGWRKGVEEFRNRLMVRLERDKTVPDAEYEAVMARLALALDASSETQEGRAERYEDICPRCLQPFEVSGDACVGGSFCPKCQVFSVYGQPSPAQPAETPTYEVPPCRKCGAPSDGFHLMNGCEVPAEMPDVDAETAKKFTRWIVSLQAQGYKLAMVKDDHVEAVQVFVRETSGEGATT